MPVNVEIKAYVAEWDRIQMLAQRIADGPAQILHQRDVFFCTARGRLKLRWLGSGEGQLVYYERPDGIGPRSSQYVVWEVNEPGTCEQILSAALGVRGVVSKTRWLYTVGQTRVHLDRVEGLGDFVELEVVLDPGQAQGEGVERARELMAQLEVQEADLIDVAYIDLLERQGPTQERG